jgi:glycosyltransferase involved in cell wall biosynthesis
MKILYLSPDPGIPVLGRKGAAVHVRAMAAAFSRAGHQVVLAAAILNKSPWEQPANLEATLLHIRPASQLASMTGALKSFNALLGVETSLPGELRRILYNHELTEELKRRFESDPPDFIYERASLYGTAGVQLARALKVPLLLELNAPLAAEQTEYRNAAFGELAAAAERLTLCGADAVLVVSTALTEHVISLGVRRADVHVIPNGVDPLLFHPAPRDLSLRARLGLVDGPVLGFVGGLRPWHGVEILPELLAQLAPRHRALRLVIVGDGPLRAPLEDAFRKRRLSEKVVFTGTLPHEEVPAVIRQFDLALAPYPRLEHAFYFSPLKLFEYMACGAAVVAADLGQISDLVRHGRTGLLYPTGKLAALTACCHRLLSNSKLRLTLGRSASKLIHTHYTWERNAGRVIELARAAVRSRSKRQPNRRGR